MRVRLAPYPEYRPSGVPWLGDIPADWNPLPGRACFSETKRPNAGLVETTVLSLSYGQIVVKPPEKLHGLVPASFETYQIVEPGQIVVRPTDLQNDWNSLRFGIARTRGIITSAYMCLQTSRAVLPEFGHFLLHTYDLKKIFYGLGSGLRQNLDWGDFKYLPCYVPPLPEQVAIVRFLDHVDRRVNRLIRAKRRLIALLNEQKQAIIHRAVTRGLDPDVRLKPSGVDWLGDVPEHWEVSRVKQRTRILRGKFTHRPRNDPSLYDGPYPFIQTGDVARAAKVITSHTQTLNDRGLAVSKLFPRGTLVMTIAANIGDVAVLDFEACFPDSVVGFLPHENVERDFLYNVFRAMKPELVREAPVNTQGNLNIDRIGSIGIALPPPPEQRMIVRVVDEGTADLERGMSVAHGEIALLREYRTRLVADVVTGKLDVREAEANLPDEPIEPEVLDESDVDGLDEETADDEAIEADD